MARLRSAVDKTDASGIRQAAHRLKSSSANVAAVRLSELFQVMEIRALENNLGKIRLNLRDVEIELSRVEASLKSTLADGPGVAQAAGEGSQIPWHERVAEQLISHTSALPEDEEPVNAAVLLVEDNIVNQHVAAEYLSQFGCRFEIAGNGQQAVEAFRPGRFDIVLMDCQMPVMDGFEATLAIRTAEKAQGAERAPIIALTANALKEDRGRCFAAGMDDYLSKPFEPAALRAVLLRNLRRDKDDVPATPAPAAEPADASPEPAAPEAALPAQAAG